MSKIKISVALSIMLSFSALSANSEDLATSLMKLRADVEKLDSTVVEEKESYRASIKSLLRQKDDLKSVLSREDLKIKQLEQELQKVQKDIKEASKNSQGLKPIIVKALDSLVITINASLPFKTQERVQDVLKIKEQVESDLITPQKGLTLAWNSAMDALRMTKENGIFKQTIVVDNEEKLSEVARIGTVMMFFKTPDDSVGHVVKESGGYSYKKVTQKEEQEQILALFDAFKKQIRSGFFKLPNAIVSAEAK
ncbi:MAG: hypothetical protein QG560_1276 [Campylobacterota bacterium]|nr:hypothetical protein [Campylobacterota bacterium]MDQ1337436.1 hypothetical protein [Campylobacterota bacterium]